MTAAESQAALRSFAQRKGWRLNEGSNLLIARGVEAGLRIHSWTHLSPTGLPRFTYVAEHRSGLSFQLRADYSGHPLADDFDAAEAPDGSRRLVPVKSIAPVAQEWIRTHSDGLRSLVPLSANETLAITPQTVALRFRDVDFDRRLQQLVAVVQLVPRKQPQRLPTELRAVSTLVRRWAISDDQRRAAQLSKGSRPELEQLVRIW